LAAFHVAFKANPALKGFECALVAAMSTVMDWLAGHFGLAAVAGARREGERQEERPKGEHQGESTARAGGTVGSAEWTLSRFNRIP